MISKVSLEKKEQLFSTCEVKKAPGKIPGAFFMKNFRE